MCACTENVPSNRACKHLGALETLSYPCIVVTSFIRNAPNRLPPLEELPFLISRSKSADDFADVDATTVGHVPGPGAHV